MGETLRLVDACLASLGEEGFAQAFCDLAQTLGIDQIMIFSISDEGASCLLSRHFRRSSLAGQLAATYLDGWFRHDPLLPELLTLPAGSVETRHMADLGRQMSADYRRIFFDTPGLASKTSLLCAGERLRLFVSLYQSEPDAASFDGDLARLAGRLALKHFEAVAASDIPAPLAVLSERERAVCLGILSGLKAEAIAAQMGVAPSTAVTYRKRAYDKLGVTSRAGLFAICGE